MRPGIVILGSAQYSDRSWVNCQQIAARLAERHPVLFLDSIGLRALQPGGADMRRVIRRAIDFFSGVRHMREGVWVASPPVRGGSGLRLFVDFALRRSGIRPATIIAYLPTWAPIVERHPDAARIYHCVDAYAENPGVDSAFVDSLERRLLAGVDAVWAVSPPLYDRLAALHSAVRLAPNVADTDAFEAAAGAPAPADIDAIPRPRILYLGNLASYKIDIGLIGRLARRRPDWHWVIVGAVGRGDPSTEIEDLRALANIHLLGERTRVEAPTYAAASDLCILPLRRNRSTESSHPLKIFEYLASGRPVVATPIPALADLMAAGHVCAAEDDASWIDSISKSLCEGAQGAATRRAEARRHGWRTRIEEIERWIEQARATGR